VSHYPHDGASAKFSTNSQETDYCEGSWPVLTEDREAELHSKFGRAAGLYSQLGRQAGLHSQLGMEAGLESWATLRAWQGSWPGCLAGLGGG
jgi:hypothetical protein